jgi:hypothetical protein
MYRDPVALTTQLRFNVNRPAYVAVIAGLCAAGVNGARATRVVSELAFLSVALCILLWLRGARASTWQIVACGLVLCAPPLPEMAALSTPDMAATAFEVWGAWLLIARRAPRAGLVTATLAIGFRPDVGVLTLLLAAWAVFFSPEPLDRRTGATFAALTVVLMGIAPRLLGGASVLTHMRFYFESALYEPARMDEKISLLGYLRAFIKNLSDRNLYHPSAMALHLLLTIVGFGLVGRRQPALGPWLGLVWLYAPVHYALFPDRSDRYFGPVYLFAALAIVLGLGASSSVPADDASASRPGTG